MKMHSLHTLLACAFLFFIAFQACLVIVVQGAPCAKKVSVSSAVASVEQVGNVAAGAIDGRVTSRWSGEGVGAYITLDLGSAKSICTVSISWYQGTSRSNGFVISTSSDNVAFSQAYKGNSTLSLDYQPYAFSARSARFVRLTVNGNTVNNWNSVNEIVVFTSGFRHPGVVVSAPQLAFVKSQLQTGAEPYTSLLTKLRADSRSSLNHKPAPVSVMKCGSYSNPDIGCSSSTTDASAAYMQTLVWALTGDVNYAKNAIKILNAWSYNLTRIDSVGPNATNAPLQAAWLGQLFVRSAELLRHTSGSGWVTTDINKFSSMLSNVFLPLVYKGSNTYTNGNWELSMAEGMINIGVFTENSTALDQGLALWRRRLPWYVYLPQDGTIPARPTGMPAGSVVAFWQKQNVFVRGLSQETCRDFAHMQYGFAGIVQGAETARHQNIQLWAEPQVQERVVSAFEFHAAYLNTARTTVEPWLCNGTLNILKEDNMMWDIGYNHLNGRLGVSMPRTAELITRLRTNGRFYNRLTSMWESLTHALVGGV